MTIETDVVPSTRSVAEGWLKALISGDGDTAISYLSPDIEFINHTPVRGYNTDMVWIGTHHGRDAVLASLKQFGAACEVLTEEVVALVVEGEDAIAVIHEVSRARATGVTFEIEFTQRMTVREGKIVRWRSFTDSALIVAALRGDSA